MDILYIDSECRCQGALLNDKGGWLRKMQHSAQCNLWLYSPKQNGDWFEKVVNVKETCDQ
jgi:hypothetical protein